MYLTSRPTFLLVMGLLLAACSEQAPPAVPSPTPAAPAVAVAAAKVSVALLPEKPTAADCLQVIIKGQPGSPRISWQVNGQSVQAGEPGKLCGAFRRGDQVTVTVGTAEAGGSETVTIANTPPGVTGISSTPKEWRSGVPVTVVPVAEDADGDPVEFRYQWLINNEADPFLTTAVLPAERNRRGDRVQLLITPFDGQDEGPVYQSYVMACAGSPPKIVSKPPARFEAVEYSYQVKATDPDGDRLAYALDNPPAGMTINRTTGLISWPLGTATAGKYEIKIVVRDPEGGEDRQEFVLTLAKSQNQ